MTGTYKAKWFRILDGLYNAAIGNFGLDCSNRCDGRYCCPQETNASIIIFLPYELEFIATKLSLSTAHLEKCWKIQRTEINLSLQETVGIAWTRECAFLQDGQCSIYQFRPFDCKSFPVMSYVSEDKGLYFVLARKCPQHQAISEPAQRNIEGLWEQLTPKIPSSWWNVMESVVVSNHLVSLPRFYPANAQVPTGLKTSEFLLRPLRTTDVQLDYAALMESKDMLREWSRSEWPADDFTLADNLKDLEKHEAEHLDRKAFTFTVLDPNETNCIGCVYIQPMVMLLQHGRTNEAKLVGTGDYEALVRFWVRRTRLENGLDERLLTALIPWLKYEWAFSRVVFCIDEHDTRQNQLLEGSGLRLWDVLDRPYTNGKYKAYT